MILVCQIQTSLQILRINHITEITVYCVIFSLVTLETRSRALVADDRVLDQTSAIGGNHHSLSCLRLDRQWRLAVRLNQGLYREALGLHGDPLGVHLQLRDIKHKDECMMLHKTVV